MKELYECHGHIFMDGVSFSEARERHRNGVDRKTVREVLSALRSAGVTFWRDGGDPYGVSLCAAEMAADYGIHFITPGFAMHKTGSYGGIVGRSFSDVTGFKALLSELRMAGGSFVKLMISGLITFREYGELSEKGMDPEELLQLVQISHEAGFPVMVHANGAETIRAALRAGADSIEHGYFMDRECLAALADSDALWVPTLAAVAGFFGREGFSNRIVKETLLRQLEMVGEAVSAGCRVASGSDSGAVGVRHGEGTLSEYRLLLEAGVGLSVLEDSNRTLMKIFKNFPYKTM